MFKTYEEVLATHPTLKPVYVWGLNEWCAGVGEKKIAGHIGPAYVCGDGIVRLDPTQSRVICEWID